MTQRIGVIGILVPQSDTEDSLLQLLLTGVLNAPGRAVITDHCSHSGSNALALVHLPEKQRATIGGGVWGVELDGKRPATFKWECELAKLCGTLCQRVFLPGGRLNFLPEESLPRKAPVFYCLS